MITPITIMAMDILIMVTIVSMVNLMSGANITGLAANIMNEASIMMVTEPVLQVAGTNVKANRKEYLQTKAIVVITSQRSFRRG